MSYNISAWTTKELTDLRIPLAEIVKIRYVQVVISGADGECCVNGLSGTGCLAGKLDLPDIVVADFDYSGEFTGTNWDNLKCLLEQSTGRLVAVQVWEGGDSITKLTVDNGAVTEERLEL